MANLINTIRGLYEKKDPNEYDNEGEMAKTQLRTMSDAAKELQNMLKDDENMPEWVQSKITKAVDYIDSVRDYMKSNANSVHTEEMVAKAEKMIAELMESHFNKGDTVLWKGMKGTVLSYTGEGDDEVYTVKCEDGKTYKIPARQLEGGPSNVNETDVSNYSPEEHKDAYHDHIAKYMDTKDSYHKDAAKEHAALYKEKTGKSIKEEVELDEDYWHVVYKDKNGKAKAEKNFKDEKSAKAYAKRGNMVDRVGGKYEVNRVKGSMDEAVEIDEDFEVTEEMIMEAFEQYMIDEGIWDNIKNFFGGKKSAPKADTGSEDNMDNDANTGGVKAGGSYKGVATYADKRDRSPIKTYKLPDSDKLKRQYDAQDKARAMSKDFTDKVTNIGQTVKDTASKIADKIPQSVKDKYSNTFSTLGKELERRIRKPFSADKGDANPYSSQNFYKDKPEYQKIDQTGYKGISQQKRDVAKSAAQTDKLSKIGLTQSYEAKGAMSLEESVRAVVLGEAKKISNDAIHIVLAKTKNAREGLAAIKKAFNVNDKEAKKLLDRVMNEEVELDEAKLDKSSPIYKEYEALKKKSIADLRNIIGRNHRVVDLKGYDKAGAIRQVLDDRYGEKKVDVFFGEGVELDEISKETLASYKKKAGEDARKADKEGDFKRGDKRFSGIVKATKKEFDKANEEFELDEAAMVSTDALNKAVTAKFSPRVSAQVLGYLKPGTKKEVSVKDATAAMNRMNMSPRQIANVMSALNEEVEIDEAGEVKTRNKMKKNRMDTARGDLYNKSNKLNIGPGDTGHATRQQSMKALGRALRNEEEEIELDEAPLVLRGRADANQTMLKMTQDYISKASDADLQKLGKLIGKKITVQGKKVIIEGVEIDLEEEINMSINTVDEAKKYGLTQSLLDAVKGVLAADGDVDSKPLDPADPKQAKGKFADRKDKDINNDGKVDKTDKYLHNRRKAVTKAVEKEDDAEQVKGMKAKLSDDVKKGKGTASQEPIEVNPNMKEEVEIDEASCKTMKEAEMTDKQMRKREEIVKSMKDKKGDFEKRYGDRAKAVMYATATKMAMKEGFELDEAALDEIGVGTVFNYAQKRIGQALSGSLPAKKSSETMAKNLGNARTRLDPLKNVQKPVPKDNVVPFRKEDVDAMSENEINEAIRHDRYINAHGKKASGEGNWFFTTAAPGRKSKETFSGRGKLGDVAKNAMKALGSKEVYVMEATVDTADVEKKKNMSGSDKSKLGKIADMLKKEREKRNK